MDLDIAGDLPLGSVVGDSIEPSTDSVSPDERPLNPTFFSVEGSPAFEALASIVISFMFDGILLESMRRRPPTYSSAFAQLVC